MIFVITGLTMMEKSDDGRRGTRDGVNYC